MTRGISLRRWPALGIALVGASCLLPAAAHATYPGHNGRIVFNVRDARGPDGQACDYDCLYSIRPGGSGLRRIAVDASAPAFSPSGRLAYVTDEGIVAANADGSGTRLLYSGSAGPPVFSPDGQQVAFMEPFGSMRVVDAERGADVRSFELPWPARDVYSWGANGRFLLDRDVGDPDPCDGEGDFLDDIYTVRRDGRGLRRLTADHASGQPDWSPGARAIAFTRDPSLAGATPPTSDDEDDEEDCKRAVPRADKAGIGTRYAARVSAARRGRPRRAIWTMSASGRGLRQVTHGGSDWGPAWSPNGKRIVFFRESGTGSSIYVAHADGSGRPRRLAEGMWPAWEPRP